MVFWGIEVKPGKPYTHTFKEGRGRLRISQATLAIGSATQKSSVQCNVGDKSPVLLCALLPDKTESLQLDLEFDELEDVMFSVIGPRGVYLTGYYVAHTRQSNMQDESESYGEDIANSEESYHCSDEDEYEDSFINDDEPEPLTPSPVSSFRDDDDDHILNKKRNCNGGKKILKKRYQSVESDDEISVQEMDEDDDDDLPISSICKNNKSEESGKIETKAEVDKKTKDKVDVDGKTNGKEDEPIAEVVPEIKSKTKTKKKKKDSCKEEKAMPAKDDKKPDANDKGVDQSHELLTSAEKKLKSKKKRKERSDAAGNKQEDHKQAIDNVDSDELANGIGSEEKKIKKKKRKTKEIEEMDNEKENNKTEPCNKKTLSNGLVIEDLVTGGNLKGKVAAAGKKVKVEYVVKLKENGQVIDSNGHKFRLGDKQVIEGLNVGLDGMRVGDKRRLTIPPSMSLSFKGTGENIPPNSWLVYDVEMTSIH